MNPMIDGFTGTPLCHYRYARGSPYLLRGLQYRILVPVLPG